MIVGTGMDIVEIERIEKVFSRFKNEFAKKILAPIELDEFKKSRSPVRFLAKRFAAKEAVAKALGTGFSEGVNPRMIGIEHDKYGRPTVSLNDIAEHRAREMGVMTTWVSISDERHYAVASAIFESA